MRFLCALLISILGRRRVFVELDLRLGARDVLRPDICVLREPAPKLYLGPLENPPLLCIEIVSPSQTPSELLAKCERYHGWGVACCWVIDHNERRAWEYNRGGAPQEKKDALIAADITVTLAQMFE